MGRSSCHLSGERLSLVHGVKLPTEAMMAPSKFGPNQVQGFILRMLEDFLPHWMPKPTVKQFEGGDIHVGALPLNALHPVFHIYKLTSGHWIVTNYSGLESTSHLDPFSAIKEVVRYYAEAFVDDWISINYTCSA